MVTNSTVSFAGSVTVSNTGLMYIRSNAVVNVGGTNQTLANASGMALTNLPGGIIELGQAGGSATDLRYSMINASTASVGVVNQGTIRNLTGHYIWGVVNAVILNDTNGLIYTGTMQEGMILHQVPTNRGKLHVGNVSASMFITNGNVVNEGVIENNQGGFRIVNGALINASNGFARIMNGGGTLYALSTVNHGIIVVSNVQNSAVSLDLGGAVTNYGEMLLYRTMPVGENTRYVFTASNIVNMGVIRGLGSYDTLLTNSITGIYIISPMTNRLEGKILSTNGAVFVMANVMNEGTLEANSGTVLAVGAYNVLPGRIRVGALPFMNQGTVSLRGGDFGVLLLTNAVGATLRGEGSVGLVALTNCISASLQTTNFTRFLHVKGVVNAGRIEPDGALSAGAISNLSGGVIAGMGAIRSANVTNYYAGETLVTTNVNTGAGIHNAAGGVILADGGTLTLENGFIGNSQYGTIGATNGGLLRIGEIPQALTNQGAIGLWNGRLACGDLTVTNGTVTIDLDNLASGVDGLVQTANLTLGGTSTLALTGAGHKAVLFRYTGTLAGRFGSVTGVPAGYRVLYGTETDSSVNRAPSGATLILIR
jgi:hypothetical protein